MEAYLDNAATTCASGKVRDVVAKVMCEDFGNPSSMHRKGMEAERYIKEAKEIVAKTLKVEPKEIVFTSGGTESNNMALIGATMANRRAGNHIITTCFEHASVYNPLLMLEDYGFRISFINVDANGQICMDQLLNEICDDTILVSVMYVNNEVGAVEPIEEISRRIKEKKPEVLFHVDAIQAFGKFKIFPKKLGIDLMSVSGHKFHGPKGSGFIYIRDKVKIKPIIYGGGQQKNYRSGTENVPAIAGIATAIKDIYENHEEKMAHVYELKQRLVSGLNKIEGVTVHAVYTDHPELSLDQAIAKTAPHIVSAGFAGVRSEVLLHALEDKGVYVSSGSACSSNHPSISGTLKAIGVSSDLLDSTIRFSFSVNSKEEEVDYALTVLQELLPVLRRYARK